MEIYRTKNLTFTYPNRKNPALNAIDLVIEKGGFVSLCGPSGCGKTTLLRHLKPSLAPHGDVNGDIFFCNVPLNDVPHRDATAKIGFVMQSPDNQIVTDKVWHELAFGLESLGFSTPEIRLRVAEMASFFGIQTWFHKPVAELSGGQKQMLALASVMAMQPSVLILDEPTSQLDPIAAGEFLSTIGKINRELGVTIVLTEQRLEDAFTLSTKVVAMAEGQIIAEGPPKEVGMALREREDGMFLAMPTPMRVWAYSPRSGAATGRSGAARPLNEMSERAVCENNDECPITVREGADWLEGYRNAIELPRQVFNNEIKSDPKPAIELNEIWFKYGKNLPDVLKGMSFKANYGEITAVLGGNGTGKTTMLSIAASLHLPYRGKVWADSQVFMLPQNPQSIFTAKTVRDDLYDMLSGTKMAKDDKNQSIAEIVETCKLGGLLDCHPFDLSGGEMQRAALAKVLLLKPQILLMDEPTKGIDAEFKQTFIDILGKLKISGVAIVIASHDVEFCAECADRCALFFDGGIVTENTPRAFFSGNSFYTTGANRMARGVLPEAITVADIVLALGGSMPSNPPTTPNIIGHGGEKTGLGLAGTISSKNIDDYVAQAEVGKAKLTQNNLSAAKKAKLTQNNLSAVGKAKPSKRGLAAVLMILVAIPLTIYLGTFLFGDRRYYFISMLVILETMLPFALVFESRKPQARELVVIAVLSAIAVAGRGAFFMLPQFKPVVALVIISGIAFGGEAGFLVGAMTGFVSNMFFGQGPWTPYQMFAYGIIGFIAGAIYKKGLLKRSPISLAVFGALAAIVLYGGIMNPANILIWQQQSGITLGMLAATYIQGIPFDLIHAASTVIFLLVISRPMLDKLDRIKTKYGLVE